MAEKEAAQAPVAAFNKGDRAAVIAGRKGIGVRGEVFWIGENKYGPGMRYGLRGDDGQTYWVDATEIGSEDGAPPAPAAPPAAAFSGPSFNKGDRVTLVNVPNAEGMSGEVFWTGSSRYGAGMRYGVRGDNGETYWADSPQVRAAAGAAAQANAAPTSMPPEAYFADADDALPPEAYEGPDGSDSAGMEHLDEPVPVELYDEANLPPEAFEQEEWG